MRCGMQNWRPSYSVLAMALVLISATVFAAGRGKVPKPGQFNPDHETVELFSGIESGQIAVKLIPKDSTQCRVLIENKTKQPLNVKLPEVFAGVPVLAQRGMGMGGGGGGQQGMMGGGMGGGGMGGGGMGGGGGMFNIQPEKVGKLKAVAVCLEHGKKDPRPNVPYEIKPIEEVTDRPAVHELGRMLGSGRINQRAAQVATWHLNNDMSFQELAAKQIRRANGARLPYFSPQEIHAGMQITAMAHKLAEQRKKTPSTADSASLK